MERRALNLLGRQNTSTIHSPCFKCLKNKDAKTQSLCILNLVFFVLFF
jgi:hypothetical protein